MFRHVSSVIVAALVAAAAVCSPAPARIFAAADGSEGLQIVGQLAGSATALGLGGDNSLYIGGTGALRIANVSDPSKPTLRATLPVTNTIGEVQPTITALEVVEGQDKQRVYFVTASVPTLCCRVGDLSVVDVTTRAQPKLLSRGGSWGLDDLAVAGDYVFVTGVGRLLNVPVLQTYDLRDPSKPALAGATTENGAGMAVALSGNRAFVAELRKQQIASLDISNPISPTLEVTFPTFGTPYDIAVQGHYAYVAEYQSGLAIYDISDPARVREISRYGGMRNAQAVKVSGGLAYIANGVDGVTVLDVSDPTLPLLRAHYDTPGNATELVVRGNLVYVADGDTGMIALRLNALAQVARPVPTTGGALEAPFDGTRYQFLTNTFTNTVTITHTAPISDSLFSAGPLIGGHVFEVTAADAATGQPLTPTKPYSVTVSYANAGLKAIIEGTLALYRWDGVRWVKEPGSTLDTGAKTVSASPAALGRFALLAETRSVFLPLVGTASAP